MITQIKTLSLAISLSLLFFSCSSSQKDDLSKYFDELKANEQFNGNVMVVKNDSIVFELSHGYAEPSKKDTLTQEYYFGIGSIQKEFPAVAVMLLKETGKLSPNDKISDYLPDLPEWSENIEIKHLLQYSSGLPQVDWNSYFQTGKMIEKEVISDISKIKKLEFEPGSDYIYSNYNNMLLRAIVENISGKNFSRFVKEDILNRYKIDGIMVQEKFPFVNKNQMAIPFNKKYEEDAIEFEMFMVMANTAGMYNWFKKLDAFNIISKESMKLLSEEAKAGYNIQAPLGRGDWENGNLNLHLHHGSSGNYEVLVRHYKSDNLFIILLTNQKHGNLHDIADKIKDFY